MLLTEAWLPRLHVDLDTSSVLMKSQHIWKKGEPVITSPTYPFPVMPVMLGLQTTCPEVQRRDLFLRFHFLFLSAALFHPGSRSWHQISSFRHSEWTGPPSTQYLWVLVTPTSFSLSSEPRGWELPTAVFVCFILGVHFALAVLRFLF